MHPNLFFPINRNRIKNCTKNNFKTFTNNINRIFKIYQRFILNCIRKRDRIITIQSEFKYINSLINAICIAGGTTHELNT